MDSINSFKGYGKVNEIEDRDFRRKTRKRLLVIGVSAVLLLVIVVGVAIGVVLSRKVVSSSSSPSSTPVANSIKAVCSVTRYPDSCYSSMSSAKGANASSDPEELFKLSLRTAIDGLSKISSVPSSLANGDKRVAEALKICEEMLDDAVDHLNSSLDLMQPSASGEKLLTASKIDDLKTWLSAAITDQETCLDAFDNTIGGFREKMEAAMLNSTRFTSNSLAIVTGILGILERLNIPVHRKLLAATTSAAAAAANDDLPPWISDSRRRALLQSSNRPDPNVTVAKDGTGKFETIGEAVALVPKKNDRPFVIYVKEGKYTENVVVDKKKWNVVLVGDGMTKTIVSGSLNNVDGTPTFATATFVADGKGFMAMDMRFENTAGPEKHQAVALRAKSDQSIFYRCSFDAFQDTLYAHSLRQFYRDCDVTGTVDFIFGDASAVLQNCTIRPRQPMPNQRNTITAQGRTDPNENTGISIHGCVISPNGEVTAPTFLGRPWKNYSTTVVMKSEIGGLVDAEGWLPWVASTVPPNTIFYGEYQNTGPGSGTAGRVRWAGYKPTMSGEDAQMYAVESFIQGSEWIPDAGVAYSLTL